MSVILWLQMNRSIREQLKARLVRKQVKFEQTCRAQVSCNSGSIIKLGLFIGVCEMLHRSYPLTLLVRYGWMDERLSWPEP